MRLSFIAALALALSSATPALCAAIGEYWSPAAHSWAPIAQQATYSRGLHARDVAAVALALKRRELVAQELARRWSFAPFTMCDRSIGGCTAGPDGIY